MTPDPRSSSAPRPLDDAAIEQLVRDVAGEWTMPAVRLDSPGWRDRVRPRGSRRLGALGGWLGRVGQAATAAVALTVVAALVAVVLTRPNPDAGKSPEPSGRSTPAASSEAQSSALPKLLIEGALPSPTRVLVQTEPGDFALVDLANGVIGGPLTGARYGSDLRILSDGSMVCLCLAESQNEDGRPTRAEVTLERYDAAGKRQSSVFVDTFDGAPDPRDAGLFIPERPPHVLTAMGYSADGKYGFVGWSLRDHPAWRNGILAVDLRDGSVTGRLALPDGATGSATVRRVVEAPRVIGSTGGPGLLVARGWHEWSPPASESPSFNFGSDVFRVSFEDGTWSEPAEEPLADDCGERVLRGGATSGGGTWLACSLGGAASTVLRRIDSAGSVQPDVRVSGGEGIDGDVTAISPDGRSIFAWDPASGRLTRIDVETGATTRGDGLASAAATGPLAAFGAWLAPSAAAKSFLQGALVVSPDGSRVYAIGTKEGASDRDMTGSAGVFAFDASTLVLIGEIWQPTADYVSLALSSDGRFVYAAGLPGVDERGRQRVDRPASITVFDTSDGSVRLIAGALGQGMILFTTPTLD